MKTFEVTISRTSTKSFMVEAESENEANDLALDEAMNHDWSSCNNASYEVNECDEKI